MKFLTEDCKKKRYFKCRLNMTGIGAIITEFLDDHNKLRMNLLNHKFYDTYVPCAMLSITDFNPVRKDVATMLKNFSDRS